ncbi:Uncharacterized protein OBRU01_20464, partial [Operophtera brumata]
VLDDRWDREIREYGTINMTGFRLVDTSRKFVKEFFANWKLDSIATQVEGLSGKIRFSSSGVRKNFSLVVVRNTPDGDMTKIATWYDDKGFRPLKKLNGLDTSGKYDRNKTYTVVSIQEPPYFTSSRPRRDSEGDEDNADIIYVQFRVSADGKYGNLNPNMIGGWDGMVGELVRKVSHVTLGID